MALDTFRVTVPVAFLVFTILQATLVDGVQSIAGTTDSPLAYPITPNDSHGIGKRSVSILAKNGDLPYYRNEWNKKLHPGFRGMNLEDKDDTSDVSKRYIGALAREGGFPMGGGKRSSTRFSTASEALPEEAILDAYLAEELQQRLQQREQAVKNGNPENSLNGNLENQEESEYFMEKRGGVGSLARGGYMPTEGRYSNGKRSVAALARSGELLSIGKGNNPDKEGGNVATKRGIGSILRNGGISTIGKIPVYNIGTLSNGKRGIESLARNYALPTILNQEYVNKYDLFDNENDDSDSNQSTESMYEDSASGDENGDAAGMSFQDEVVKKHLGSFARSYGLRFPNKRNIGSILRNKGTFHFNGKRGFESNEDKYPIYDKRYISSLLKNQKGYLPDKRDFEGDYDLDAEKRHLASILSNKNGKRYLGSIARQGLLSGRNEKRENLEDIIEESSNMKDGYLVDKRSIVDSQPTGTTLTHTEDGNTIKGTAEYELRNVASPVPSEVSHKESNGLQSENLSGSSSVHEKQYKEQPSHRQRRSLYSTSDEYAMPVLQNTDLYDWETTDEDDMPNSPEKRFMGSLARWRWFPRQFRRGVWRDDRGGVNGVAERGWTTPATYEIHKRHIGALARLGWLPAIRSQRRYSRGLGKRSVEEDGEGREDTEYGTEPTKNWYPKSVAYAPETQISLIDDSKRAWSKGELNPLQISTYSGEDYEDPRIKDEGVERLEERLPDVLAEKRYLLLPAMDHLLLRKLYPRHMLPLLV